MRDEGHDEQRRPRWVIRRVSPPAFWFTTWTPSWHDGRGRYISIGCGFFALFRGY